MATVDSQLGRPELMRVLAHELRNYIAPIHNAMHLIRLKGRTDPTLLPVVDIVERQLGGMTRALEAVSDVDRLPRGALAIERAPADLPRLVQQAHDIVRAQLEARRQRVEITLGTPLPQVDVDAARITRVLAALLDNAARYGPDGARIAVEAHAMGSSVELSIADEGPGIPADVRERAFEFFAAPHRPGQGLGLGLPLAAAIVRLHGGEVDIDAAARGSRIVLRLPAVAPAARRNPAARDDLDRGHDAEHQSTGRRVLIADDSAAVRASLTDLLQEFGHEVRAAADGEQAVEMAQQWEPEFVLLDIHMPRLGGFAAARKLRALYSPQQMQLVMMSGEGLDETIRRGAAEAGFDHCIDKGLAIGELTELLSRGPRSA